MALVIVKISSESQGVGNTRRNQYRYSDGNCACARRQACRWRLPVVDRPIHHPLRIRTGINQKGQARAGISFQHGDTEQTQLAKKNVGKTRKHQISAKIDDGILVHSANSHLEGNSEHGLETSITGSKEKERNTRKPINCNLRGINQNLQKIQENDKNFETRNKTIKEYKELLVAKLLANLMESRKCAATMLRTGKQEGFESTRCDTFDRNTETYLKY